MKKPILFILYISFACCIGFVGGVYFSGFYNQDIVLDTISKHNDTQEMFEWYKLIVLDKILVEDLSEIKDLNDVQNLKEQYIKNSSSHIELFRQKAGNFKKKVPNPAAIKELEDSVDEIEQLLIQKTP